MGRSLTMRLAGRGRNSPITGLSTSGRRSCSDHGWDFKGDSHDPTGHTEGMKMGSLVEGASRKLAACSTSSKESPMAYGATSKGGVERKMASCVTFPKETAQANVSFIPGWRR